MVVIDPLAAVGGDAGYSLCHCTGVGVEVVPTAISVIFALDHSSLLVEAHPLSMGTIRVAVRNVYILVAGNGAIGFRPVPGIGALVVEELGMNYLPILIPVAFVLVPSVLRRCRRRIIGFVVGCRFSLGCGACRRAYVLLVVCVVRFGRSAIVRIVVVRRLALNIGVFGGAVLLANKAACGLVRGCIVRSQCDCWI